jgi:hypothetical protein
MTPPMKIGFLLSYGDLGGSYDPNEAAGGACRLNCLRGALMDNVSAVGC